MTARTDSPHLTIAALVGATIATVFPGFLTGALAVQVGEDLDVSEATYGWGLGGFAGVGTVLAGLPPVDPQRPVDAIVDLVDRL